MRRVARSLAEAFHSVLQVLQPGSLIVVHWLRLPPALHGVFRCQVSATWPGSPSVLRPASQQHWQAAHLHFSGPQYGITIPVPSLVQAQLVATALCLDTYRHSQSSG